MFRFRAATLFVLALVFGLPVARAGTSITFNGATYTVPSVADANWGQNLSNYLTAIASGTLQKTGGSFTLTNDVNFGFTYGVVTEYLKSETAPVAGTGVLRLGNGDAVTWRNAGNSADLALSVNGSNVLTFGGNPIVAVASGSPFQVLTVPSGGGAASFGAVALGQSAAVTGTLGVASGGTGLSAGTSGGVLAFTASGTLTSSNALPADGVLYGGGAGFTPGATAAGATGQLLLATTGAAPSWGAVNLGTTAAVTGTLAVANGGTGNATLTSNGVLYGNGSSALNITAQGGANTVLTANSGAPAWSATPTINQSLTIGVNASKTGTLVLANGGGGGASVSVQSIGSTSPYNFNLPATPGSSGQVLTSQGGGSSSMTWASPFTNPMSAVGDTIYGGTSGASNALAGNTTSTKKFLTQTGTGSVSAAPSWGTLAVSDMPAATLSTSGSTTSDGAVIYSNGGTTLTWQNDDGTALTTTPTTYNIRFARSGGVVVCEMLFNTATASSGHTPAFKTIDTNLRPSVNVYAVVAGLSSAGVTNGIGIVEIATTGVVTIYNSSITAISANATTTQGVSLTFSYNID